MECPECGRPASEDDLFCGECGAVLDDPVPATVPAPPVVRPPVPAARDSRASVAQALGMASVAGGVVSFLPLYSVLGFWGLVLGVFAIALGALVKRDVSARGGLEADQRRAQQGMILGIVGIALSVALTVLSVVLRIGLSLLGEL
jgi:predicted nucleic acid-binding Zn ribbon protein